MRLSPTRGLARSRVFRSAVDRWLLALVLVVLVIAVQAWLQIRTSAIPHGQKLVLLMAIACPALFLFWLLFGTWYRIGPEYLELRCGPWRRRIARVDLLSAEPIRSLGSAPALSQERLLLLIRDQAPVMVSPEEPAAFLAALGLDAGSY